MWDLHGPGLEPVSPALAGGFLTTAPPGKSRFPPLLFIKFLLFFNLSFTFIKVILLITSSSASLVRGQLVLDQLS